jgi:hypothetical protein
MHFARNPGDAWFGGLGALHGRPPPKMPLKKLPMPEKKLPT